MALAERRKGTFASLSGTDRSRQVVLGLSASCARRGHGDFVIQSFATYWFYLRYDMNADAGVARSIGAAISPLFLGILFARPSLINVPLFPAGGLKILYDLLLYRRFPALRQ